MGNTLSSNENVTSTAFIPKEPNSNVGVEFEYIPAHLQHTVLKKFRYTDFAKLSQANWNAMEICHNFTKPLDYWVHSVDVFQKRMKIRHEDGIPKKKIPWQKIKQSPNIKLKAERLTIKCALNSGRVKKVTQEMMEKQAKVEILELMDCMECAPKEFGSLVAAISPEILKYLYYLPHEFFRQEAVQQIQVLLLDRCGISDVELIKSQARVFSGRVNNTITPKGINAFLKQWKTGERDLRVLQLDFDENLPEEDFGVIIEGLDANVVWTPEYHNHSVVSSIPAGEYEENYRGHPRYQYCMWNSWDAQDIRLIRINKYTVDVRAVEDETFFVYAVLNYDQWYSLFGTCKLCDKRFCAHRTRTDYLNKKIGHLWEKLVGCATYATTFINAFFYSKEEEDFDSP